MDWLMQIAPTIATAFGGPLAGLAVTALAKVFGVPEKDVQGMIESGKMTADQLQQVKIAELELQKQAEALGLNFETLATEDRKSARDMQIATKSIVPPVLAGAVTVGFFGILYALMMGYAKESNQLMIMLGSLGTAWTGIIAFYFGSSNSSQHKDEMLYNSTPTK
jgi:hypothetical protein